jgi:hypothetical protein
LTKPPAAANGAPGEAADAAFPAIWERALQEVGPMRGVQLRQAGLPAIIGPNALAIRFPTGASAAYDSCASEASVEVVRATLRRLTRNEWSVRVEQAAGAADPPPAAASARSERKDLLQLPLFRHAAEVLAAQLMRVEEGFNPRAKPAETAPDSDEV